MPSHHKCGHISDHLPTPFFYLIFTHYSHTGPVPLGILRTQMNLKYSQTLEKICVWMWMCMCGVVMDSLAQKCNSLSSGTIETDVSLCVCLYACVHVCVCMCVFVWDYRDRCVSVCVCVCLCVGGDYGDQCV